MWEAPYCVSRGNQFRLVSQINSPHRPASREEDAEASNKERVWVLILAADHKCCEKLWAEFAASTGMSHWRMTPTSTWTLQRARNKQQGKFIAVRTLLCVRTWKVPFMCTDRGKGSATKANADLGSGEPTATGRSATKALAPPLGPRRRQRDLRWRLGRDFHRRTEGICDGGCGKGLRSQADSSVFFSVRGVGSAAAYLFFFLV